MNFNFAKIGFWLAFWQIKRASPWTTVLIIFIMTLTFLNLVVVSGILIGLVQGSSQTYRQRYSGDILVKPKPFDKHIEKGGEIIAAAKNSDKTIGVSSRYLGQAFAQSDIATQPRGNQTSPRASATVAGIDPIEENKVTGLAELVVEGGYFSSSRYNAAIVGSGILSKYNPNALLGETIENVVPGSSLRIIFGQNYADLIVTGIVKSKIGDVNRRIYIDKKYFESLFGRPDEKYDEIAIKILPGVFDREIKSTLRTFADNALIETAEESQGTFLKDITATFSLLGSVIGGIALMVSSITIFIVIFINALTRKKYIGIMKAIGISESVIISSYLMQAIFYSLLGIFFGSLLLYTFIKPYFDANPIDFPFSDGILAVTLSGTALRALILLAATTAAGIIPILLIVKKNTLDMLLGRD